MKTDKIVLSPWFMSALFALALLTPPYASKGFAPNIIPDIVAATLSNSFVKHLVPYSFIFQITALLFFLGVVIRKDKFGKAFTAFAGISFIVYAFVQNIAITDKFGVSLVLSNILLCFLTSFMWLRDLRQNRNRYIFRNFNRRNAWLLPIALFCFWWPMNFSGTPDFNPAYFLTGQAAQAIQFCPMTPIFLIILIFCKPTISLSVYRMSGIAGTIIGFWNMMSFFHPYTFYVGIYHLPLFFVSLYVLIDSFKIQKHHV